MTRMHLSRIVGTTALLFAGLMFSSSAVWAQSVKVEGIIKARNGDTMILQTQDSPKIAVLLTDETKVGQVEGVFQARRKEMSMAALIPGLVGLGGSVA